MATTPRKPDKRQLNILLDAETYAAIEMVAQAEDITCVAVARRALRRTFLKPRRTKKK